MNPFKHKQGHTVVTDRLAGFVGRAGVVSENVQKFIAIDSFKGGRRFGAYGLIPSIIPMRIPPICEDTPFNNLTVGNAISS